MGLDASVMCNCWRDGHLRVPAPYPELMAIDEEGYLELTLPWQGNEATHTTFEKWKQTACAHRDMNLADERIGNWASMRLYHQVLETAGVGATLRREVPFVNGGQTTPEIAHTMRDELRGLLQSPPTLRVPQLIEIPSRRIHRTSVDAYGGEFAWLGDTALIYTLDAEGFAIWSSAEDRALLFSSRHFVEEVRSRPFPIGNKTWSVVFTDVTSRHQFNSSQPAGDIGDEMPLRFCQPLKREYVVETGSMDSTLIVSISHTLLRLCDAAIASGNPIRWC